MTSPVSSNSHRPTVIPRAVEYPAAERRSNFAARIVSPFTFPLLFRGGKDEEDVRVIPPGIVSESSESMSMVRLHLFCMIRDDSVAVAVWYEYIWYMVRTDEFCTFSLICLAVKRRSYREPAARGQWTVDG